MGPEVLLSAMHLADESYIDSLNIHSSCVIINQCDRDSEKTVTRTVPSGQMDIRYVETTQRGLSKSRNMAIRKASGPVCILCDNDVEYVDGYDEIINGAFAKYDADLIVFFIKRPERSRPIFKNPRRMGYLSVLKIFSPEIAFRLDSVKGIGFNELFGAGAKYFMGEENLFLYECLKRKKKIVYVPEKIAEVRDEESTWFKGYNKEFFVARGANYAAMSRIFSVPLILQFAVRKRKLYSDSMGMIGAIIEMFRGRREYENLHCR
ncbi:MAG: glycosyltransferase [Lachnospiraceae bacterium]|nr:glycosyltransferase [Lachnospiraceae bacterium]